MGCCLYRAPERRGTDEFYGIPFHRECCCEGFALRESVRREVWVVELGVLGCGLELVVALSVPEEVDSWGHC